MATDGVTDVFQELHHGALLDLSGLHELGELGSEHGLEDRIAIGEQESEARGVDIGRTQLFDVQDLEEGTKVEIS